MKTKNPLLEELRAVREALLAEAGGTLDALVDPLQAEEEQSPRPRFETRRSKRRPDEQTSTELPEVRQSSPVDDR